QQHELIGAAQKQPPLRVAQHVVVARQEVFIHRLIHRRDATLRIGKNLGVNEDGHAVHMDASLKIKEADALDAGQIQDVVEKFADFHGDRKSTRLNSSHVKISYAVFCLKKKNKNRTRRL